MPRYASRAFHPDWHLDYLPDGETKGTEVIVENEDAPTGLLDAKGNMIWRLREPVGFIEFGD